MPLLGNSISLWLFSCRLVAALTVPQLSWTTGNGPQGSPVIPKAGLELKSYPKVDLRSATERFQAELSSLSAKFGVDLIPGTLIRRAGPGTSNNAYPVFGNAAYNIQLNIGGQKVAVDPDTGSNILWVPSAQIAGNRPAPYSWNPAASTTSYSLPNTNWSVSYVSASLDASGQVYGDTIYWDDVGTSAALRNANVFYATKSGNVKNNGMLGLDHNMIARYTQNGVAKTASTFFQQLIPTLPQPLFSVDFKHQANGSINFGYIDSSKYIGNILWGTAQPSSTFWQAGTNGYKIQASSAAAFTDPSRAITFFIDTGSSIMYLSKDIVSQYWSYVSGAVYGSGGYWLFPCTATLPSLTIYFGGNAAVTPGRYFNYGPWGNGSCYGGLQNNFMANDLSLFGDAWIKSQFLVFMNATSTNPNAYIGIANKTLTT